MEQLLPPLSISSILDGRPLICLVTGEVYAAWQPLMNHDFSIEE